MLLKEGTYDAKITSYGYKEVGENHTPVIEIEFTTADGGKAYYNGWLTEASFQYVEGVLATCGLKGKLFDVAQGPTSGALDMSQTLSIKVQNKKNKDGTPSLNKKGEQMVEVRFVNKPRGAMFDEALKTSAANKLASFESQWSNYKTQNNIKTDTKKPDAGF